MYAIGPYPAHPRRLAIVPARGGSKGLPGKNMARIGGETLTARAVRLARSADLFDMVLISTEDPAIAEEAVRAGAEAPFLRPPELAADRAVVVDAVRHALGELATGHGRRFDLLALLEPTSPLRTVEVIRAVVAAAEADGTDAALSVAPVPVRFHAYKQFLRDEDGRLRFAAEAGARVANRQELPRTWLRNGMCYAVRTAALDAGYGLLGSVTRGIAVEAPYVNIDEAGDLAEARRLIEGAG